MKSLLCFLFCFITQVAVGIRNPTRDADLLPGWRSEQASPTPKVPKMVTLHEEARIFLFEHFLTDAECDHIIALASSRMERSGVVDQQTGGGFIAEVRTSSGAFLDRAEDSIIAGIEKRIARWTLLPVGNGEPMQVLRYDTDQKYEGHFDYFFDEVNTQNGGNRHATVLLYLNDVEEGGETTFPNLPAPRGDNGPGFSDCARRVLAVRPRKGSAVLFHNIRTDGRIEERSKHSACPVVRGEKWSAPKWIRVGHFTYGDEKETECVDRHEACPTWAAQGECEKNPKFMMGGGGMKGQCRRSCKRCS